MVIPSNVSYSPISLPVQIVSIQTAVFQLSHITALGVLCQFGNYSRAQMSITGFQASTRINYARRQTSCLLLNMASSTKLTSVDNVLVAELQHLR